MSRTTPDSCDLMPEVLKLLKRKRQMKKREITTFMRQWIEQNGFDHRDRSIGWALNRLAKEDYLANPKRGIWQVTEKGSARARLTPAEAREIMKRWTETERKRRNSN
jgi:restriction endonuclease Mrr